MRNKLGNYSQQELSQEQQLENGPILNFGGDGKEKDEGSEDRYLIFRIANESFATPLLSIREIVEPLGFSPVPNAFDYFLGLANLRGQIVGVLDLGTRFGLGALNDQKDTIYLVFDVDGTSMAGIVNSVESVTVIDSTQIAQDTHIHVAMAIPSIAVKGVARLSKRLLPIVQLQELVRCELKMVELKSMRPA